MSAHAHGHAHVDRPIVVQTDWVQEAVELLSDDNDRHVRDQ